MARNPLFSDTHGRVDEILQEGDVAKAYVSEVTRKYAACPDTPLDGSLHPSLRSETTELVPLGSRGGVLSATATSARTEVDSRPTTINKTDAYVTKQEDAFKAAIREYESKARDRYKTGISPDDRHTMEELEVVLAESIKKHEEQPGGLWGKIDTAFRKLGERKDDINGWLGLLPSESEYFSVVCGGFKMIVEAAARLSEVHGKVLDALYEIPAIIDGAQRVLHIYPESERLESLSRTFYVAILSALGHIMHYLRKKASSRIPRACVAPFGFEADLVGKIDAISKSKDAFNEEADICQKEMLDRLNTAITHQGSVTAEEMSRLGDAMRVAVGEQKRANRVMEETLEMIRRRQSDMGRDIKDVKTALNGHPIAIRELLEVLKSGTAVQAHGLSMTRRLDAPARGHDLETPHQGPSSSTKKPKKGSAPSHQRQKLLSRLDYDQDAAGADLVSLYGLGPTLSRDDQERSIYFIKSDKLANWVSSTRSTALVVNGNARGLQRRSALSFACARLAFALEQIRSPGGSSAIARPDVVPLYFFCGQHGSGDRSWESPSGVINSLLAQLLTQCRDLDLTAALRLGKFDNEDVRDVCKRFEAVIAEIPAGTTVLCVIDSLSFYLDDNEVSEEAERLVRRLLRLVRAKSRKKPCSFKLVLTASNRLHSPDVEDMDEDEVVNVPGKLPNTGGFTAMKWNMGVGQQLESLAGSD